MFWKDLAHPLLDYLSKVRSEKSVLLTKLRRNFKIQILFQNTKEQSCCTRRKDVATQIKRNLNTNFKRINIQISTNLSVNHITSIFFS